MADATSTVEDTVAIQYGGDLYPSLARALRAAWADFRQSAADELSGILSEVTDALWAEFALALEGAVFVDGIRLYEANLQDLCGFQPGDEGFGLTLVELTRLAVADTPVFAFRGEEHESLELALLVAFGEWNGGQIVEAEALEASAAVEELKHWMQGVIRVDGQKLTDWNSESLIGLGDTLYDALIKTLRSLEFA